MKRIIIISLSLLSMRAYGGIIDDAKLVHGHIQGIDQRLAEVRSLKRQLRTTFNSIRSSINDLRGKLGEAKVAIIAQKGSLTKEQAKSKQSSIEVDKTENEIKGDSNIPTAIKQPLLRSFALIHTLLTSVDGTFKTGHNTMNGIIKGIPQVRKNLKNVNTNLTNVEPRLNRHLTTAEDLLKAAKTARDIFRR